MNNLSLIKKLKTNIELFSNLEEIDENQNHSDYFPSLLWVLRDFSLKFDNDTSKDYLES